jgi:hypothetical protein
MELIGSGSGSHIDLRVASANSCVNRRQCRSVSPTMSGFDREANETSGPASGAASIDAIALNLSKAALTPASNVRSPLLIGSAAI